MTNANLQNFRNYNINIYNDNSVYLDATLSPETDTSPYIGIFYHEEPNLLSIELPTKDEYIIGMVTSLCKSITENIINLDAILTSLNDAENSSTENYGCFRS